MAREQFRTLYEAEVLIDRWRKHYNEGRPHWSVDAPAQTIAPPCGRS